MKKLSFTKMHGLGNDFILIDGIGEKISARSWDKRTVELCDRFRGVGADGVILALPSRRAVFEDAHLQLGRPRGGDVREWSEVYGASAV